MKKRIKINFSDFWFGKNKEKLKRDYIFQLLSTRFNLEINDNPDFLIYSVFGKEFLKYNCVRILYTGENIRPNFNECDYAFSFDFPVTDKNYRLPLYRAQAEYEQLKDDRREFSKMFGDKTRFCNFLYSNKRAKQRIEFFNMLQRYKRVDSGGKVLNNLGYFVDDKISFLKQYKFTIAFENSSYPGYTTEKILHAFAAGSIPIYWGNPIIEKDFNTKAFINSHEYENFEKVIEHVIEVDTNDELYKQYLGEPVFPFDKEPEYLEEDKILDRFETIFSNGPISTVAKKRDIFKYHYLINRKRIRKISRGILKSFKNFVFLT